MLTCSGNVCFMLWHEFAFIGALNSEAGQFQTDFRVNRIAINKLQSMEGSFVFFKDYNDDFDVNRPNKRR